MLAEMINAHRRFHAAVEAYNAMHVELASACLYAGENPAYARAKSRELNAASVALQEAAAAFTALADAWTDRALARARD